MQAFPTSSPWPMQFAVNYPPRSPPFLFLFPFPTTMGRRTSRAPQCRKRSGRDGCSSLPTRISTPSRTCEGQKHLIRLFETYFMLTCGSFRRLSRASWEDMKLSALLRSVLSELRSDVEPAAPPRSFAEPQQIATEPAMPAHVRRLLESFGGIDMKVALPLFSPRSCASTARSRA
jgi:hypothetical protein